MGEQMTVAAPRTGSYRAAALKLAERDPVIARLVAEAGLPTFPRPTETHFATLVRSIVYQQLAGAAARAIHGRLIAALNDDVSPERVLAASTDTLRAAGLSARKVGSLRDLAAKVLDGTVVLDPRRLGRLDDEEIITRLSTVLGIGRWSAQIFLIYQLRRLDIWPTGDLGVRRGYSLAWQVDVPTPKQLEALGEDYRPFRTVVAWYCWRAVGLYSAAKPVTPIDAD
jgi:DNA-3-methyladenine glycosylase II